MIEKRNFTGGLNSDDEDRYIPAGDYRYALNATISMTDNGANFAVSNTQGNVLVNYILPAGANQVIGCLENVKTQSSIYFVYNSSKACSILQYLWTTNVIVPILIDNPLSPILPLNPDFKITGINLVNDELLYWTDNNDEPLKINIVKAKTGQYVLPMLKEYIYAIKQPPLFPPPVVYANDPTRVVNYLQGFLFQFKYRYIYDDYEKSAFSPISSLALPSLTCSDLTDTFINNALDITIETGSTIVTGIEVAARIGNTGDFFSIVTLEKSDPYTPLASNITTVFRFFNEKSYLNVNLAESNKLFDNLPKKAKSQELIDPTRITYGDVLDGFDPVTIVSELDLKVNPQPKIDTFSISGRIYIKNPFCTDPYFAQTQAIYESNENGSSTPVFGGVAARHQSGSPNKKLNILPGMNGALFDQGIPLRGFVVYLAGTDHYAVSQQPSFSFGNQATAGGSGVFDLTTNSNQSGYWDQVHTKDPNVDTYNPLAGDGIYSQFTISGIPAGKYSLRIASNLTTQADLDNGSRAYQKTSTSVVSVAELNNDPTVQGGTFSCEVEITNTGIDLSNYGDIIIYDLSFPHTGAITFPKYQVFGQSMGYSGYYVDNDFFATNKTELLNEPRIELSRVFFSTNNVSGSYNWLAKYKPSWYTKYAKTDHNGFYFAVFPLTTSQFLNSLTNSTVDISDAQTGSTNLVAPSKLNRYNGGGGGYITNSGKGSLKESFIQPVVPGALNNERTFLEVGIIDSGGAPISGVSVVVERGSWEKTDSTGVAKILVYADSDNFGSFREDDILYSANGSCVGVFTPTSDSFNIGFGTTTGAGNLTVTPYSGTYNYNITVETTPTVVNLFGFSSSSASLKRAGQYQYGIVYYDHANRSGVTNTNNLDALTTIPTGNINGLKLYVPYYTQIDPSTSKIYDGGTVSVDWEILNEPPSWATHYQWVRTKNSANNKFIQFVAKSVTYTDDYGNSAAPAVATKIKIDVININTDYKKIHNTSQLYYDWVKKPTDDRVRLIKDGAGNFFNSYAETAVVDYNNDSIVIENLSSISTGLSAGFLFEVYNPKLALDVKEQLFWEIDECYEVGYDNATKKYYHKGPTTNQDPTTYTITLSDGTKVSTIGATGTFKGGDTYYRLRDMPVATGSVLRFIEDPAVSDFYASTWTDIGRPNRYDPDFKEIRRPSTIFYSELYIPETKVNNLNSFYDTNFETYEQKYGSIQKLYNENHALNVFQELKVGQIPVNLNIIYDNSSQGIVGTTAKVLNHIQYYAGEFGIGLNPESFAVYGNSKYFVDRHRFAVLRLDRNGIIPISDIKMHGEFISYFKDVKDNDGQHFYGAYDLNKKKYLLSREPYFNTLPSGFKVLVKEGKTIAFNEATNRWESYYSYLPEFMSQSESNLITFKSGKVWLHNSTVYNNFYGIQYNTQLHTVFNQDPSKKKAWMAMSQETKDAWKTDFTTPNGQQTNLILTDFEQKENFQYASLLFDTTTPNVADPLNEGDTMRDVTILSKMTNDLTAYTRLFAVNMIYENSERSNK